MATIDLKKKIIIDKSIEAFKQDASGTTLKDNTYAAKLVLDTVNKKIRVQSMHETNGYPDASIDLGGGGDSTITESFTTTETVGGLSKKTQFAAGTSLETILKAMLITDYAPYRATEQAISAKAVYKFYGDTIPTSTDEIATITYMRVINGDGKAITGKSTSAAITKVGNSNYVAGTTSTTLNENVTITYTITITYEDTKLISGNGQDATWYATSARTPYSTAKPTSAIAVSGSVLSSTSNQLDVAIKVANRVLISKGADVPGVNRSWSNITNNAQKAYQIVNPSTDANNFTTSNNCDFIPGNSEVWIKIKKTDISTGKALKLFNPDANGYYDSGRYKEATERESGTGDDATYYIYKFQNLSPDDKYLIAVVTA